MNGYAAISFSLALLLSGAAPSPAQDMTASTNDVVVLSDFDSAPDGVSVVALGEDSFKVLSIIRRFGLCYADDTIDLYKDRAQTWILVPSVTGHPGWGGPFNPSVEFVLPLGRFDADDLDDATDVRLSLDFE